MALALRRSYQNSAPAAQENASGDAASSPGIASRGAVAFGSLMLALARLVRLVTSVVVLLIIAAIVLVLLNANPANTLVHDIHSAASTLVGPFRGMFSISRRRFRWLSTGDSPPWCTRSSAGCSRG